MREENESKLQQDNARRLVKLRELRKVQAHVAQLTKYQAQLERELKALDMNIDGLLKDDKVLDPKEMDALLKIIDEKEAYFAQYFQEVRERIEKAGEIDNV